MYNQYTEKKNYGRYNFTMLRYQSTANKQIKVEEYAKKNVGVFLFLTERTNE